ncbi:MAG: Do family serine endopeptidase [Bryobacteraceae bacterium]
MNWLERFRRQKLPTVSLLVFTLCTVIVMAALMTQGLHAARGQAAAPDAAPLTIPPIHKLDNEFVKIAKAIEPSVVYISTDWKPKQVSNRKKGGPQGDQQGDDDMDLFHRFFGDQAPFQTPPNQKQEGSGSGFVVDKSGYILTNLHVVDNADHIKVKLTGDPKEYKARLIGSDVETDVAVIKIEAGHSLTPVRIANSDGVQVGDWAIAVGAPFGLETSVTAGIISALGRDIAQQFQRFIQTDAAINPGNSGGPLLNYNGEVIGINTMIATRSGGYEGIGFALPINIAARAYNSIIETGRVVRGSIGISFPRTQKTEELKAYGYDHGVVVEKVTPGGPAATGGIKSEDIILSLDGKTVKDGDDLVARIAAMPVGEKLTLSIDRDGQKMDKQLVIGDREKVFKDDPRFAGRRPQMTEPDDKTENTSVRFGIGIRALGEELHKELGSDEPNGVQVTTVEEDSFADQIGIKEKDVITSIDRHPVGSFEDVKKIQSALKPGDPVAFRVLRQLPGTTRGQLTWTPIHLSGTLPNE